MKPILLTTALLFAAPAAAETGVTVALPEVGGLARPEAEALLAEVVRAVVAAQNCARVAVSPGEWALLTGTGDLLTVPLGLDHGSYDAGYWRPAFADLDRPETCRRAAGAVRPLIGRLKRMGGGTEPL